MITSESFFYFGTSRSLIKQAKQWPFSEVAQTEFRKATGSYDYLWNKRWKSITKSFFSFLQIKPKVHIYTVANLSIWRVSSYDMTNIVQVTRAAGLTISAITGSSWGLFLLSKRVSPPSLPFAEINSRLSSILDAIKVILVFLIALNFILGIPHWESSITILYMCK